MTSSLWRIYDIIFIFGDVELENQNLFYFVKFSKGGKIEKLITKMSWDWPLMILAENLQFPMKNLRSTLQQ